MPVPALPVADFIVVQSALALRCLEALLDLPALPSYADKGLQRGFRGGRIEPIVRVFGLWFDAAPNQQPVAPAILFPTPDRSPVVQPFAFAARTC